MLLREGHRLMATCHHHVATVPAPKGHRFAVTTPMSGSDLKQVEFDVR